MHQTRASDCSNESSPYHSHFLFPFPFPGCICAKASSATCHCLSAVAVPNDSSLCFGFCFCSSFWFWFRFRWMVVELRCSCCSCLQCGLLVPFPFPFSLPAQMCATAAYLKKKKRRGTRRVWRNRGSMSCHSPLLLFRVLLCHWRGGHRSARVQSSQLLLIKRACQRQDTDTCGIQCEDRAQQEKLEPLCFTYDLKQRRRSSFICIHLHYYFYHIVIRLGHYIFFQILESFDCNLISNYCCSVA